MEQPQKKAGRPVVPADLRKKHRSLSFTDAEYLALEKLAEGERVGVSAYVVKRLKLS